MNKNIKRLIYVLLVIPIVYISLLLVIDFDVNNKRPILSVFKLLQNEGSQEIVDFSIKAKKIILFQTLIKIGTLITATFMFIQNTLLMPMFLE
jgi:hypothetical protein